MKRWKEYPDILTDSLWQIPKRDSSGAHHAGYHGLFVPDIPRQAMLRYTRQGHNVLDAFVGSGTTLIEARRLGRHAIGIDLNPVVCQQAIDTAYREPNPYGVETQVLHGNAISESSFEHACNLIFQRERSTLFDLIILHPPYHDIIKFSDHTFDLSNCADVPHFIKLMRFVLQNSFKALKQGHFMVLVMGDTYKDSQTIPLSYMLMNEAVRCGFILKAHCVKDIQNNRAKANQINLWRYRALQGGFYIFKHENIFFFFKPYI